MELCVLIIFLVVLLHEWILAEIGWHILKRRVKRRYGTLSGLGATLEYQDFIKKFPRDRHDTFIY